MEIIINKIIHASNAISHSDGILVYEELKRHTSEDVFLSFEKINRVSTAFLNACIGKLIVDGTFNSKLIDRLNTNSLILKKIDSVIDNAKNHEKYNGFVSEANFC